MKGSLYFVILLLLPVLSAAQTNYFITHESGTQPVGINPITVTPINGAEIFSGLNCGAGPYKIGDNGALDGFKYDFGLPVKAINFRFTNVGGSDTIAIYVNNNFYSLTPANISSPLSALFCTGQTTLCTTPNGRLAPGSSFWSKAHVEINDGTPISTVTVMFASSGTGVNYSIFFAVDPHVYIKEPFTDTIACVGDSIQVPVIVSDTFNTGNILRVQLSDQNGDFTNGTMIGSRHSNDAGNILCGIPANLPEGTGYHFRIIASLPADTSAINLHPIRVAHHPSLSLTSNSPLCDGETLRLNAASNNTNLKWTGPDGFTSTIPNPSLPTTMKQLGEYKVTADNYGCLTTVATQVEIKPIPNITLVKNNSPKCENEEIVLEVKASDTATRFSWTGPSGFVASDALPRLHNARISANGVYSVIADLNGCVSAADTTTVTIYPRPEKPVISVNNPVKPGDSLSFHATGGPDASYKWSGPAGFNSTEQNPVKRLVDVNDEGEYTVVATMGDCFSSSSVVIDVLQAALDYHLTPNPTKGAIHIYGNYLVGKTIPFAIVNSAGQTVYSGQVNTSEKFLDMKLDLERQFSKGVYFISLQLKDEMLKIPFVIDE